MNEAMIWWDFWQGVFQFSATAVPQFRISEENGVVLPWTKVNLWLIYERDCTREAGGLKTVLLCSVKCFWIFRKMLLLKPGKSQGREYLSPTRQSVFLWFHRSLVFAKSCYPDRQRILFFFDLPLIFACVGYCGKEFQVKKFSSAILMVSLLWVMVLSWGTWKLESLVWKLFLSGAPKKASSKVFNTTHKWVGLWLPKGLGRAQ